MVFSTIDTPLDLTVPRKLLSNMSVAYMQDQTDYIADKVFPIKKVTQVSGEYIINSKADFMRDEMREHSPNTVPNRIKSGQTKGTYLTREYSVNDTFDESELNIFLAGIDLEARTGGLRGDVSQKAMYLTMKALIQRETSFSKKFMPTVSNPGSVWAYAGKGDTAKSAAFDPSDVTGTNNRLARWSSYSGANVGRPIDDIIAAKISVQRRTGFKPNKLILAPDVLAAFLRHPDTIELIGGGSTTDRPAIATMALLANQLGLDEVIEAGATVNPNGVGAVDATDFLFSKTALLVYAPNNDDMGFQKPQSGVTFVDITRRSNLDPQGTGIAYNIYKDAASLSWGISVYQSYDQRMIDNQLGYLFTDIV
jgi:hypothetical protein